MIRQVYLVRLCNIREDNINHANQHAVPRWVPSILNNGDHIGSLLCHIDKIPTTPVRELNSIDQPILPKQTILSRQQTKTSHESVTGSGDRQLTGPTISDTWDTVVPEAAPRYSTRVPGAYIMKKKSDVNLDKSIRNNALPS